MSPPTGEPTVQPSRSSNASRRERPEDAHHDDPLSPLVRARKLTRCFLYWLPVRAYPVPLDQRVWLIGFLDALSQRLSEKLGVREEVFLQYKTTFDFHDRFLRTSKEFFPVLGLTRKIGSTGLQRLPSPEDFEKMQQTGSKFELKDWTPDYCFWMRNKLAHRQREEFFGFGGMMSIYLKPDPGTKPPELPLPAALRKNYSLFQVFDVDAIIAGAFALRDGFLPLSKQLFGKGLEQEPAYRGLQFIMPLLESADFFHAPQEQCDAWFQLFDVYLNESPTDRGILLASKTELDAELIDLLQSLKQQGVEYPR